MEGDDILGTCIDGVYTRRSSELDRYAEGIFLGDYMAELAGKLGEEGKKQLPDLLDGKIDEDEAYERTISSFIGLYEQCGDTILEQMVSYIKPHVHNPAVKAFALTELTLNTYVIRTYERALDASPEMACDDLFLDDDVYCTIMAFEGDVDTYESLVEQRDLASRGFIDMVVEEAGYFRGRIIKMPLTTILVDRPGEREEDLIRRMRSPA
ncbi:MAG: hypothetical protein QGG50_07025 [Methanopyri archaeon]|jgi:hypothetical protein|nr:hypothetical protein [Methanopyri archaeon]